MKNMQSVIANNLIEVLEEFRKYDGRIEIAMPIVFLVVMRKPGIRMKEIEKATGLLSSAISRNVAALSSKHYLRGLDRRFLPGMDFVFKVSDPLDNREKLVRPTNRGVEFFDGICMKFMAGTPE